MASKFRGKLKAPKKACPKCGSVVIDLKKHKKWHKKNKPRQGPPGAMGPQGPTGADGGSRSPQYSYKVSDSGEQLTPKVRVNKKGKPTLGAKLRRR